MQEAETSISANVGTLSSTFSPTQSSNFVIDMIFDVLNPGYGLIAAGIWNKVGNELTADTS